MGRKTNTMKSDWLFFSVEAFPINFNKQLLKEPSFECEGFMGLNGCLRTWLTSSKFLSGQDVQLNILTLIIFSYLTLKS